MDVTPMHVAYEEARADAEKMKIAVAHMDFCAEIYLYQMKNGRHFLHEHPASATSWAEEKILKVLGNQPVGTVVGHMCQCDTTYTDKERVN